MNNILDQIISVKLKEISELKKKFSVNEFKNLSEFKQPPRNFLQSLVLSRQSGLGLIAEIKKSSPSKGIIREDFHPKKIAVEYKKAGASCISVLTDEKFFMGKLSYLRDVKKVVDLPILRKDFILDPIQIYESRAYGADCILLIMACISDEVASKLYNLATSLKMDVLVEIHNAKELERALKLKPTIIGINNRNLKTMKTTLYTTISLLKYIPKDTLIISESGFKTNKDIKLMKLSNVWCFLIGETFMKSDNIYDSVRKLISGEEI